MSTAAEANRARSGAGTARADGVFAVDPGGLGIGGPARSKLSARFHPSGDFDIQGNGLRLGYATQAALGGSAVASFNGTMGGAGPQSGNQAGWVKLRMAGVDHFVPTWR